MVNDDTFEIAAMFVNMFISFSYPLNFIIYCCMSHHFRTQFAVTFCRQSQQAAGARDVTSSHAQHDLCVYELVRRESRDQVSSGTNHVITLDQGASNSTKHYLHH